MMSKRPNLWTATVVIVIAALSLSAMAADPHEAAARVRKALDEKSFTADLVVKIDGRAEAAQGKLSRMPPDFVRLEHFKSGKLADYYLEGGGPSVEVLPAERRALIVPGRRIGLLLDLVSYSLESASQQGTLAAFSATSSGKKVLVITGGKDKATFKLVLDINDYLPREYTATRGQGSGLTLQLQNLKVVSPSHFPKGFFSVPEGFRVTGRIPRLDEAQRERLHRFRSQLNDPAYILPSAAQSSKPVDAAVSGGRTVFLPVLPTRLPPGFVIDSVTPLYFSDNLLYHIELVEPAQLQLISIFETQHQRLLNEFRKSPKRDRANYFDSEYKDGGIYVIIISDDVDKEEFGVIFESLNYQPQLALELLNRSLAKLLSE